MSTNRNYRFISFVAAAALMAGCGPSPAGNTTAASGSTPFSSEKSVIKYAHGFTIDYHDHYKEVKILNHSGSRLDTIDYLLVQEGYPAPSGHAGAQVITIPVKNLVVLSSAHVAQADFAGVADRIIGLGDLKYVTCPVVREGIKTGKVKETGVDANVNNELIISMHPGLVMAMTNPDAAFSQYKTLIDAGIPVLPNAEWLETTPLGRAEWVKLMGALVNKEDLVDHKFDSLDQTYRQLAAIGQKASNKPSVIIGMPYKGAWYTPAGESYMAQFLKDAGASYPWANTKGTGSLSLTFEGVAPEALKADYWLNLGYVSSKKDITAKDNRFAQFKPFTTGALYNFNRRVNDLGSNDYYESGLVNPQRVLEDLIRILHPGLLPQDSLYYYKQLQ